MFTCYLSWCKAMHVGRVILVHSWCPSYRFEAPTTPSRVNVQHGIEESDISGSELLPQDVESVISCGHVLHPCRGMDE